MNHMGIPLTPANSPAGTTARAILRELESMLTALVEREETASIDLRALPFGPEDRELLSETLGVGEVSAEVESIGPTRVFETAIAGVWWITHANAEGSPVAEFIEVTYCPEILITPAEDARDSLQSLRARLFESEHMSGSSDKGG